MTNTLAVASEFDQVLYRIGQPASGRSIAVVASLPHSGTFVPPSIANEFTPLHQTWLRNTDWHLPQVYDFLPELGVTTITATHSRYVVDLNRDPERMLFGSFKEAVIFDSMFDGTPIYQQLPDSNDLPQRLASYHSPYHQALSNIIGGLLNSHERVLLFDLHAFFGPIEDDICIGDLRGISSRQRTTSLATNAFERQGLRTVCNDPFSGGYLIKRHFGPLTEALQIELRYTTYMDCSRIDEPIRPQIDPTRLQSLKPKLRDAFNEIIGFWCGR